MLTALQAIVGSEWVTGVIAPITPKGACSMTASPMVTAKHLALQKLHTRHLFSEHTKFLNLVLEAANLRFRKLHPAELFGVVDGNAANVGNRPLAAVDAEPLELLKSLGGGPHGLINAAKHTVGTGERSARHGSSHWGCGCRRLPDFGNHLTDNAGDVLGIDRGGSHSLGVP
jgi:hypothetical protein